MPALSVLAHLSDNLFAVQSVAYAEFHEFDLLTNVKIGRQGHSRGRLCRYNKFRVDLDHVRNNGTKA